MGLATIDGGAHHARDPPKSPRLAVAMGGGDNRKRFWGLAGMGDLVLTCTGSAATVAWESNWLKVGSADVLGSMVMIAEGVESIGGSIGIGVQVTHRYAHYRTNGTESCGRPLATRSDPGADGTNLKERVI